VNSDPWQVVDTPCHPRRWKVEPQHTYAVNNDSGNFFESQIEAQEVADSRNDLHRRRHIVDLQAVWGKAKESK